MSLSTQRIVKLALVLAGAACVGYSLWQSRENWQGVRLPRFTGTAKVVAVPPEIDFKADDGQTNRVVEIVLRNEGSAAAKLLNVATTCGCTSPSLPASNTLPPGEEARLSVRVQPPPYGSKDSTITVKTDPPRRRTFGFPCTCTVGS